MLNIKYNTKYSTKYSSFLIEVQIHSIYFIEVQSNLFLPTPL